MERKKMHCPLTPGCALTPTCPLAQRVGIEAWRQGSDGNNVSTGGGRGRCGGGTAAAGGAAASILDLDGKEGLHVRLCCSVSFLLSLLLCDCSPLDLVLLWMSGGVCAAFSHSRCRGPTPGALPLAGLGRWRHLWCKQAGRSGWCPVPQRSGPRCRDAGGALSRIGEPAHAITHGVGAAERLQHAILPLSCRETNSAGEGLKEKKKKQDTKKKQQRLDPLQCPGQI